MVKAAKIETSIVQRKVYFSKLCRLKLCGLELCELALCRLELLSDKEVVIKDFMSVTGLGSANRQTFIFNTNIGIVLQCGCFYGTEKEFKMQVKGTHNGTNYEKEYLEMLKLAKIRFGREKE